METYRLHETEQSLLESSCIPLAVYQYVDQRVVTLALSAGFCELFGYDSLDEAVDTMNNDMYRTTHPDDVARISEEALLFARREKEYNTVYRNMIRGEYRIIHAVGKHEFREGGVQLAYITYMDEGEYHPETGLRESGVQQISRSMAYALQNESGMLRNNFDYLTGLFSMTAFFDFAEKERLRMRGRGDSPAILFIDPSGMNPFNRKHGLDGGNQLLREIAKLLSDTFGTQFCSRFGQDHFAVLTSSKGLTVRLKKLFEDCRHINGGKSLPLRVGIYLDELEEVSVSTACDRAKVACNLTRKAYYSHYRYFRMTMLAEAERKQYFIDNLDRAMEEQWIRVYYQPIVRAANGRVCDEEALSRWIDPEKGLISPADYIPVLEDAGLIFKLDLYVVEQVLKKIKVHEEAGLYIVPQSVNLSRSDFDTCDIVSEIIRRVDGAGIAREKLTIEITESMVGSNYAFMKPQIERLRSSGFHVWMDDFGSGYSSLDVLQTIPFDLIKLDMRFLQNFNLGESGRVILTGLVRLASSLGIETVCEGVETEEQAEFLKEIGCTKLQGYYYCKPIPEEAIRKRYETGEQIGFENPEESGYYSAIGRISLYDLSAPFGISDESSHSFLDAMPMAILESIGDAVTITRCNRSYRLFMNRTFKEDVTKTHRGYLLSRPVKRASFLDALETCCEDGRDVMLDEQLDQTTSVHSMIQRIAVNPLTGAVACRVVILGTEKQKNAGLSFARLAQSLSSDYANLYYVNLETEEFVEYRLNEANNLSVERHGSDFFHTGIRYAGKRIYPEDLDAFIQSFTKENIERHLDEEGVFTTIYRRVVDGRPVYMNMKAVRTQDDDRHLIIGISNVDAEMRRKEALERLKKERIVYERIMALSGNYLCLYSVDPDTEDYREYNSSPEHEELWFGEAGSDFFRLAVQEASRNVHPDDRKMFVDSMEKTHILNDIRTHGLFSLNFRLIMKSKSRYVNLRAALVEENESRLLIIGILDVDAQTRRELDNKHNLSLARSYAKLDALTGVKNAFAYAEVAEQINRAIAEQKPPEIGLVVCDVLGMKAFNLAHGREAGDEYLKEGCRIVCESFRRSPVFRIEGGVFAVLLRKHDYLHAEELMKNLEAYNQEAAESEKPILAYGCAFYGGEPTLASLMDNAYQRMHVYKERWKADHS